MTRVTIGPREADMLMDGLLALEGTWEDRGELDPPVPAEEIHRLERLMSKLKAARRREVG